MKKKHIDGPATRSEGLCDLTGLPCLSALNLARQMAKAVLALGDALSDTFGVEAEVEVAGCLRPCTLSIEAGSQGVRIARAGRPLASAGLDFAGLGSPSGYGSSAARVPITQAH